MLVVICLVIAIHPFAFADDPANLLQTDGGDRVWTVDNQQETNDSVNTVSVHSNDQSYHFYIGLDEFTAYPEVSDVYPYMYDKKVYYAKALLERIAQHNAINCGGNDTGWYYGDDFIPKVTAFKKEVGTNYANGRIEIDTWFWIKVYTG